MEHHLCQGRGAATFTTQAGSWAVYLGFDRELQVDLGRKLKFQVYIVATTLRPDTMSDITSATSKQVLLLELTVLWGNHIDEVNERKQSKYQELVEECRRVD